MINSRHEARTQLSLQSDHRTGASRTEQLVESLVSPRDLREVDLTTKTSGMGRDYCVGDGRCCLVSW